MTSDPERRRAENVQAALYRVAELAGAAQDMQEFYEAIHVVVGELMDARNFYIALYDETRQLISWPYYVDEVDVDIPDPNQWAAFGEGDARGTTAYVLRTGEPELISYTRFNELVELGEVELVGISVEDSSWLGVPLKDEGRTVGVLAVQSYTTDVQYTEQDKELLAFVGQHVGTALSRARAIEETRQRNAELALINSVQEALAGELELQAIYEVVGDKLRDVFDAQVVDIGIYDESDGLIHFPYTIERGVRFPDEPIELIGFRRHVMETREPLLIQENVLGVVGAYGNPVLGSGEVPKSVIYVPLVAGGKSTGAISLQNFDREHAFADSDVSLLTTICGSLSVALENARLVHETRQRNAQLALINSVQDAIAGELDPQAIYDLVGDRLQEVFDAQVVSISVYDEATRLLSFPYVIERGERLHEDPIPLIGFRRHVIETREPLMLNENLDAAAETYGNPRVLSGDPVRSCIFVPLVAAGKAIGVVSLQNVDREHAFTESDLSLLTAISGSLSVALENARLVHETRQRVAELGTVNSVGEALATQLELDALIELVGERVRETFEADIAYVALHDESAGRIEFAYYYESGERRPEPPLEYGQGITSQILDSREPLLLNREEHYEGLATVGTPSRSYLGVPVVVGEHAIGVISVQSIREEGRFGEADARLLATIAANVGVAIQKARLFTEIARQKQYFESLVEINPVAVVVLDAEEHVSGWNPAAAELFGHTADEAIGLPVDDLVFGEDARDEGREITREAVASGRAQRITRRRRKDGTPIDVELMLVPLTVDGERTGFLAIYHDITELQLARQEAEAATQAKSAFLATMSHEIRTPMNAVIGMTGLLLDTELTAEQREFAEVVRASGDALLHVIDDILDYSKIEAGKLELEKEPVDLRECVEGALDIVAPHAWEKAIELGCLIDEDAPAGVVGDAGRLRQVLLNLLSNAVKFTERGEVIVHVGAERTGEGSHRLAFAVRDTGIGIPADRVDTLFDSFSQVDASTTRRYGGTGLGLAISKRLVELMGGTLSVESEVGTGSTFHIELPARDAALPTRRVEQEVIPQLAGKRVLIVDDNATNCEIVTRHTRSWGMEPVAVEAPADALARVAGGEPFDVAVLDMMMPGMDGLTLARELRRHRDERTLPLILLTSLGRLPQAQSSGEFAVQLAKPVKGSQLYNALVKALAAQIGERETDEPAPDAARAARSSLRILLAEDNVVNQKVALRLLDRLGYQADVVSNGLEALDALEQQRYDVVLMDVQMPELDGLDASRRICERWPADSRPRIVAMTANAMPEDREACLAAGMDDYVAKPISPDVLAKALSRARPAGEATGTRVDGVAPKLDPGAVQSLKELGGDEFVAEVIDTFLGDAPGLVATLRAAHGRADAEELRRTAHTLKSNGQTFGAQRFSELCRELEERAKEGDLERASELLDPVERSYAGLEQALVALRAAPAR